jgi:hypothetical protein
VSRYVVCPYVDMFNHKSNCVSDASYNYFSGQFQLFTSEYKKGDQVFVSYGKQSNDRLFQYYGFIEKDNPNDVYEFNDSFIDVLFKYADDISKIIMFPTNPTPKSRLEYIADALRGTSIQSSDDPNASKSIISAIDFKSRFSRTSLKVLDSKKEDGESVEEILSRAKKSITQHFDDVTVRCMRAFLCTESEWMSITSSSGGVASLKNLDLSLSSETEVKVSQALCCLARLELASKPTSLDEDLATLTRLENPSSASQSERGFSKDSKPKKATTSASNVTPVDPSGSFRDSEYAITAFRIEKKRLLAEAIDML